jgi:phosphoribosyl-ATP pyrophosphohydrolase
MAKSAKKKRPQKAKAQKAKAPDAGPRPAKKKGAPNELADQAVPIPAPPLALSPAATVLDRLWSVVMSRRDADPAVSHSARLLSRGTEKVAQKFGEEAVECLIEAVARRRETVIGESADVLYHLIVLWVDAGIRPDEVWNELKRREGVSGIAEKASRARKLPLAFGLNTTKIP